MILISKHQLLRFFLSLTMAMVFSVNLRASHHIDCSDPLNANHSECAGFIDCNDPINLIYPQCQGGGTAVEPVAPVALFNLTPSSGPAPLTVTVNATASSDSDGQITSYNWSASDGQSASGQTTSMTFNNTGTYTIILTVTDNQGLSASSSKDLTVTASDCLSVFDAVDSQLTLTWVNLLSGQEISARYSNVVMQLLSTADSSLQFQVSSALAATIDQQPATADCVSSYEPANGLLIIPAVKASSEASSAAYNNVRMKIMARDELIFQLDSVEVSQ